jgi:hypothetical protein
MAEENKSEKISLEQLMVSSLAMTDASVHALVQSFEHGEIIGPLGTQLAFKLIIRDDALGDQQLRPKCSARYAGQTCGIRMPKLVGVNFTSLDYFYPYTIQ